MADTTPHFKGDGKLQFRSELVTAATESSANINLFFSDINATNNTAVLPKGAVITAVTLTSTNSSATATVGDIYVRTATTNTTPAISYTYITAGASVWIPTAGTIVPTAAVNTQLYIARSGLTTTGNTYFIGSVEYKIVPKLYA